MLTLSAFPRVFQTGFVVQASYGHSFLLFSLDQSFRTYSSTENVTRVGVYTKPWRDDAAAGKKLIKYRDAPHDRAARVLIALTAFVHLLALEKVQENGNQQKPSLSRTNKCHLHSSILTFSDMNFP
jgi:hypothetical protein